MQATRIAAVSMNGGLGDPVGVLGRIDAFCRQAAERDARLVLFPELVVHGHCTPNTQEIAEPVPNGPSVQRLIEFARSHDLVISAGLSEQDNGVVYNTQVLVGPSGYIGRQRKLHMSRDEGVHYTGGTEIEVFDIGSCRAATVICYDNQFPEVARICALRGADVLLMPHAAREARWDDTAASQAQARRHMLDMYRQYALRARENACFAVVTDQAGVAGCVDAYPPEHPNQPHHAGGAAVFDPRGRMLAAAGTEAVRDEMIVVDLDPAVLDAARDDPNYTLRTRRVELFGDLTASLRV